MAAGGKGEARRGTLFFPSVSLLPRLNFSHTHKQAGTSLGENTPARRSPAKLFLTLLPQPALFSLSLPSPTGPANFRVFRALALV